MASGEIYVSTELIGIIGAAIALATVMLASMRGVRREVRDVRIEMKESDSKLRDEMKQRESRLEDAINGLRDEVKQSESRLRDEMTAGFRELTARVVNIGDRLSKVEGIIEGMFWSARNQPPDKPREGAA